jgi:predicted nucleotidyltransferase
MIKLEAALKALTGNNVNFVIIDGVAITAHGSAYLTQDLDFCYSRSKENLKNIVSALSRFKPRPRGFPENPPYIFDETTLQNGTNFTFKTDLGDMDLLGEVAGVGGYDAVNADSELKKIFGYEVKVLSIEGLIKAKRAAGRTKDLLVLPELEALREALSDDED